MSLPVDLIRRAPTVVLHDHLDGGVRPRTVLELEAERHEPGPGATADEIRDWFYERADSGSLVDYLRTFERTVALMQTAENLTRIAREFVEDLVDDGVVYAETRWAPELHVAGGLTVDAAVDAVQAGLDEGVHQAAANGRTIVVAQLLAVMRHRDAIDEIAPLVVRRLGSGVVGIDVAGPELGHPAGRLRDGLQQVRAAGGRVTIHAGEADGVGSIADALACGAERIGHGVRLLEDIADGRLGPTAADVRERGILLEVCPSSNLQTGIAMKMAEHPFGTLHRLGFRTAVSCDNRLMSRTSTSRELALLSAAFGLDLADLREITVRSLAAGFAPASVREALLRDVVLPRYAELAGEEAARR